MPAPVTGEFSPGKNRKSVTKFSRAQSKRRFSRSTQRLSRASSRHRGSRASSVGSTSSRRSRGSTASSRRSRGHRSNSRGRNQKETIVDDGETIVDPLGRFVDYDPSDFDKPVEWLRLGMATTEKLTFSKGMRSIPCTHVGHLVLCSENILKSRYHCSIREVSEILSKLQTLHLKLNMHLPNWMSPETTKGDAFGRDGKTSVLHQENTRNQRLEVEITESKLRYYDLHEESSSEEVQMAVVLTYDGSKDSDYFAFTGFIALLLIVSYIMAYGLLTVLRDAEYIEAFASDEYVWVPTLNKELNDWALSTIIPIGYLLYSRTPIQERFFTDPSLLYGIWSGNSESFFIAFHANNTWYVGSTTQSSSTYWDPFEPEGDIAVAQVFLHNLQSQPLETRNGDKVNGVTFGVYHGEILAEQAIFDSTEDPEYVPDSILHVHSQPFYSRCRDEFCEFDLCNPLLQFFWSLWAGASAWVLPALAYMCGIARPYTAKATAALFVLATIGELYFLFITFPQTWVLPEDICLGGMAFAGQLYTWITTLTGSTIGITVLTLYGFDMTKAGARATGHDYSRREEDEVKS